MTTINGTIANDVLVGARELLVALDVLVDRGDRRAAAIQTSEVFKEITTGVARG